MGNFDAGFNDTIMKSCRIVGGFFLYHNWTRTFKVYNFLSCMAL